MTRGAHQPDTNGFETGDRVLAAHDIGGMFRPRIPRGTGGTGGTGGTIIELTLHGSLIVHFTGGHRLTINADDITLASP